MKNTTPYIENSELYIKIDKLGLSTHAKARAFSTLKMAESFINALQWLQTKPLGRSVGLTGTTKLKHQ